MGQRCALGSQWMVAVGGRKSCSHWTQKRKFACKSSHLMFLVCCVNTPIHINKFHFGVINGGGKKTYANPLISYSV